MPRQSKPIRLWLQPEERSKDGKLIHRAAWVIRDGARKVRTGCAREDRQGADRALAEYICARYSVSREQGRHSAEILVLDVLNIYLADVAKDHARPDETKQRVLTLADFWQPFTLADVTGTRCREYVRWRVGRPWKSAKPNQTGNAPRLVTELRGASLRICARRSITTAARAYVLKSFPWCCQRNRPDATYG